VAENAICQSRIVNPQDGNLVSCLHYGTQIFGKSEEYSTSIRTTHGFQNNAEGSHVIVSDCVYYRICSPQQKIRQEPISGFNYREMSTNTDGNTLHKLSHRCLHLVTVRTFAQANDCKSCTSGSRAPGTASPDAASDIETHLADLETV